MQCTTRDPRIVQSFKSKCNRAYFKITACAACANVSAWGILNDSEFVDPWQIVFIIIHDNY